MLLLTVLEHKLENFLGFSGNRVSPIIKYQLLKKDTIFMDCVLGNTDLFTSRAIAQSYGITFFKFTN